MSNKYISYEDVRNDKSIEFIEDIFDNQFINLNEPYKSFFDDYYKLLDGSDEYYSIYSYFKLVNIDKINKLIFISMEKKFELIESIITDHKFTDSCEEVVIYDLYKKYKNKIKEKYGASNMYLS